MDMLTIQGGTPLRGTVRVEGAKNAALPIMAACLAVRGQVQLAQVPDLVDVATMTQLLQSLGCVINRTKTQTATIDADSANRSFADYELVRRMRASICVLGPLLARFGKAQVSLPGGCNIGHRPIDLHLKGLAALGADLRIENGYVVATATRLRGADVELGGPSGSTVTGTCNVMVAAALAKGRTTIRSAACEPEVVDLGNFLNAAGAQISGLGTSVVEISGVESLQGVTHTILPDRIEAATFAIAAAATRGNILIPNARTEDLTSVIDALRVMGVRIVSSSAGLEVSCHSELQPVDIVAMPYPGIPTDTQAQFMACLCTVQGVSKVRDAVFPDRFMHAAELLRMGANLQRHGDLTVVHGGQRLTGASVMASDLRASAALVIAGLAATDQTTVRRIYHLDRGYARLEEKLTALGAPVSRVPDSRVPDSSNTADIQPPHFKLQKRSERTIL
jgi:UDP-N-acetylglucosamine 1-carboxyvinyltransferase